MKRIDLKIGFRCNNNCRFCAQAHKKKFGNKSSAILKRILSDSVVHYQSVVFTGGEPTVRDDIVELVQFAKKVGFKHIQIQSNGRMFSYKDFCHRLLDAGANEFALALHGHKPELHDFLTRSNGSFKQTFQGIKNLLSFGQVVITNTVITKPNYRYLPNIARLLVDCGVRNIQFAFVHILGNALKLAPSVVPRKSMIAPFVREGLDIGIAKGANMMTEAIPYCFLSGYEDCVAEERIPETKVFDLNFTIHNFTIVRRQEGKAKGARCKKCMYQKKCEGPWREYPQIFGWKEFNPVLQPIMIGKK